MTQAELHLGISKALQMGLMWSELTQEEQQALLQEAIAEQQVVQPLIASTTIAASGGSMTQAEINALSAQQSASSETYAKETVAALQAAGIQATVVVAQQGQTVQGLTSPSQYAVQVGDYTYLISPSMAEYQGSPGNTAAQIVSNIGWESTQEPEAYPEAYSTVKAATPATKQEQTVVKSDVGTVGTTTSGTSQTSTPASGTVTTSKAPSGLAGELFSVMDAQGFDTKATYNGFEWAWFYQRCPSYSGLPMGPTEMGLGESDKIGLLDAAQRISNYISGGVVSPTVGPAEQAGIGLSGNWKTIALIVGGTIAGLILLRAFAR